MKEFEEFNHYGQSPIKKTNKTLLISLLIIIPFFIRLVFYNVVYDLPLGWIFFSLLSGFLIIIFGKSTFDGWKVVFYADSGILAKYLFIIIIPIFITAFFEDLKLSQKAIVNNSNYTQSLSQLNSKDSVESVELIYDSLSVVNKIGGQMIYFAQLPFLGFFNKIDTVRIYQSCLIKKVEGQFSEKNKEKIYDYYFQSYWEYKGFKEKNTGVGQIIQKTYSYRIFKTAGHLVSKVFFFKPFDECK
jgi:hypothetical protein